MPFLWVTGTNDFAYPLDSYSKTYGLAKGKRNFEGLLLSARYFFDAIDMSLAHQLTYGNVDEAGTIRGHATACSETERLGREVMSKT